VVAAALATLAGWAVGVAPAGTARVPDGTAGKTAGVVVSADGTVPQQVTDTELSRLADDGFNTAVVYVYWDVDSQTRTVVSRSPTTITDPDLELTVQRIRDAGMKADVHLLARCTSCANTWRGSLHPTNVHAFFESYRAMVDHYASLAQATGVSMLFVGGEMTSLQTYEGEWRQVIASARARYRGKLSYVANWDALGIRFWDALDVVAVSAYYPLSDVQHPSVAELVAGWHTNRSIHFPGHHWFDELAALAQATHRQVLFGEVGYRSVAAPASQPYDAVTRGPYDGQSQANAYQAVLSAFEGQAWWAGALWWQWSPVEAPTADTTFDPRDKPAEDLLARWYRFGWRPGDPPPAPILPMPLSADPVRV
jgi:hypothetical protein